MHSNVNFKDPYFTEMINPYEISISVIFFRHYFIRKLAKLLLEFDLALKDKASNIAYKAF